MIYMSVPITKATEAEDGTVYVEGIATDDGLDLDDQIIDKDFATQGLKTWFQDWANVRAMHSKDIPPAGKAVEIESRPEGTWVRTHVVEPGAINLVKNGVYQAYSVGISRPRIIRDGVAKNGRVVDGIFSEISLVDFPANPRSRFQLAKRASAAAPVEIVEKTITPSVTKAKPSDMAAALKKLGKAAKAVGRAAEKATTSPVGLTAATKKKFTSDLSDSSRNPTVHVSQALHRLNEWASTGSYPTGLSYSDVKWMASQCVDELKRRNPDSDASMDGFPGPTSNKAAFTPEIEKCQALQDALTAAASDSEGDDTRKSMEDYLAKADGKCDTCKGDGKIMEGHRQCPDCKGSGLAKSAEPEVAKGKKDCANCGKSHDADSDATFCAKCGAKLPGVEKKLPPHREPDGDEVGPDLDGDGDGHSAPDKDKDGQDDRIGKAADSEDADGDGEDDADEDEDDQDDDGGEDDDAGNDDDDDVQKSMPYHLIRLHDATCAAFSDTDVLVTHPSLAKGIPGVVDPAAYAAEVTKALLDDAGTGARSGEIPGLSTMYALSIELHKGSPELLEQAMGDLRKAFTDYYPDAHPSPQNMTPGSFKRPYISAGHANQAAKAGQKPRVPLTTHAVTAEDFNRPLLTDGREAASPGSVSKGRTYYTNAAKEQATAQLTAMHDYIVQQHPGACPMHEADFSGAVPNGAGSSLDTATAAAKTIVDMRDTAVPTPVADPTVNVTPNVTKDVTKTIETLQEQLDTLGKRLADLESAPDPASAAVRGGTTLAALRPAPDEDTAGRVEVEAAALVRLVKKAKHPDSEVSRPAIEQLLGKVGASATADLLK